VYADSGGSASKLVCVDAQLAVVNIRTCTFTSWAANYRMLDSSNLQPVTSLAFVSLRILVSTSLETSAACIRKF